MSESVMAFGRKVLTRTTVTGKVILDVGASPYRAFLGPLDPKRYLGISDRPGSGVEAIIPAHRLSQVFAQPAFDILLCIEQLHQMPEWARALLNMKTVLHPGGLFLLTTRSLGCPVTANDVWRFQRADLEFLFSDFEAVLVDTDPEQAGVFLTARKPTLWHPMEASGYPVYPVTDD